MQLTAHHLQQFCHYGHSQPCTLYASVSLLVQPPESFKQRPDVLFLYADACVSYLNIKHHILFGEVFRLYCQRHRTFFGILDRICQQI